MKKFNILFALIALLSLSIHGDKLFAQLPTIGQLHTTTNVSDGYTLFTPEKNKDAYLINICGEVVNTWSFSEKPAATCYLLENGNLLRAGKDSLEIRDWNNNLVWSYAMNLNGFNQHHDIEPLPNGNILCVVTDNYSDSAIIEEGRDSTRVEATFKLDKIVELQPVGTNNANVVWEWKVIDHLIQDFDSTKANFGVVEDHPELIDINFNNGFDDDYTHFNAVDYNAQLDHVMITVRHLSELHVIDHSTTTAEAAGHTGGVSGKGGDLIWRWGNPAVYKQGSVLTKKLFFPHDGKWVDSGYADEGKITVFNNGGDTSNIESAVHLLTPDFTNNAYTMSDAKFLPETFEWSWSGSILGEVFYESKKSGTHALPNGNFMICENSLGQVSEINRNGDLLWVYRNPAGSQSYQQFDTILNLDNSIFRAEKYPSNFLGFNGMDLTPQGIIENENSVSEECAATNIQETISPESINVVNPACKGRIQFTRQLENAAISVTDINGRIVYRNYNYTGTTLAINLNPAMYFIRIQTDSHMSTKKLIVH